ncbi:hypothetical protein FACS1894169_14290 [Bacteroidia bacterium]|nr:hypothetical protein FACS1894169_14290 [Bacteroidia bacterium]
MWQKLSIPENITDSAKIILNYKTANLGTCILKAIGIDDRENAIYQDSIEIKQEAWSTDTLTISLKNTRYLILGIFALGHETQRNTGQKLWLDRMEILIGNRNYYSYDIPEFSSYPEDNYIIPLDTNILYKNIQIPKNKKIIALGESVHGSGSISHFQIEMLRKLITENNCRLVVFEGHIYSTPYWNLFIQGKLPENKIEYIRLNAQFDNISDPDIFCDFLLWLREYNSNAIGNKVSVAGNVDIVDVGDFRDLLFDYINIYYNENTKKYLYPLLKFLNEGKLKEAQAYISENISQIKGILGETGYDIFNYILSRKAANNDIRNLEQSMRLFLSRDYSMYQNSQEFIRLLLAEGETAAVIAHWGHTDKKNSNNTFPYVYPMGYYFHEFYGDSYYNIGFTVGTGSITSLKDISGANIKYPADNSLEKLCMEKQYSYFYYQDPMYKPIHISYRRIGNPYSPKEIYDFGDINAKMDAFVFIRESKAFRDMDKLKKSETSGFMFERGMERGRLMKEYNKQNEEKK